MLRDFCYFESHVRDNTSGNATLQKCLITFKNFYPLLGALCWNSDSLMLNVCSFECWLGRLPFDGIYCILVRKHRYNGQLMKTLSGSVSCPCLLMFLQALSAIGLATITSSIEMALASLTFKEYQSRKWSKS